MMDDVQEQNEIAEEISTALSQPIGFAAEIDDVSPLLIVLVSGVLHSAERYWLVLIDY